MSSTQSQSKRTIDHEKIREWAEERDGRPAIVEGTKKGESGVLRIDFGDPEQSLEEITWEQFFMIFDDNNLTFLYQDKTANGKPSRFNKFVERSEDDRKEDEKEEVIEKTKEKSKSMKNKGEDIVDDDIDDEDEEEEEEEIPPDDEMNMGEDSGNKKVKETTKKTEAKKSSANKKKN